MRLFLVLAALVVALPLAARQQQPTFRSRVDVVTVDVHVVDGSGRPVADLRPDDFTVMVDGKVRSIQTADYVSFGPVAQVGSAQPAGAAPRPAPPFTSNRSAANRPGRFLLLVVDEENIRAGYGRGAADAANRFLDAAPLNDRIGLVVIPRSGIAIDPTLDRRAVREALQHVIGHMGRVETQLDMVHSLGLSEAFALRNDPERWAAIVYRECGTPPGGTGCAGEMRLYATTLMDDARQRTLNSTRSLLGLLNALAAVPGPKTVVFVSEELPVSSYLSERTDFNAEAGRISQAAARAQVTFYVLQLHRPAFDVEDKMAPPSADADDDMRAFGLETVTSLTGGKRLMVSGRVDAAMDRVALETSGYYLLGFRAEPGDRDGKPHQIKVAVARKAVELRARPMFTAAPQAEKPAEANANDVVNRLLRTPDVVSDLPVSVTTYVLPNPGDPAKLRVIVATEIERGERREAVLTVGYVIVDDAGKNAGASVEQVSLKPAAEDAEGRLPYLAAALVPPGHYRIRVAAADGNLRAGSVEHRFDAVVANAPPLELGDLVVFDRHPDAAGKPRPTVSGDVAASLGCYLEARSLSAPFAPFDVRLEVADSNDAPARATGRMEAPRTAADGRLQLSGAVPLVDVPPGDYVARAIISTNGTVIGRVHRAIRVVADDGMAAKANAATAADAGIRTEPDPANAPNAGTVVRPPEPGTVEEVVARAGRYVVEYGNQMSLVIGTEHYTQWMQNADFTRPISRQLVSEFALVRTKNDWDGFRDVIEVDGKAVADRRDRLTTLFSQSPGTAVEQSRKIAAEGARYNLGAIQRNFNVPTTALFFLQPANSARFRFSKNGDDTIDGTAVWKVRYEETRKPTIIRTSSGKDMPVSGTFWIDPTTGRVLKTHMEISAEAQLTPQRGTGNSTDPQFGNMSSYRGRTELPTRVNSSASITVSYKQNAKLGLLVPDVMLETYEGPARSAFTGNESLSKINCRATYSDFKRFETGATVVK